MEPLPLKHLLIATAVFVAGGLISLRFDASPMLLTMMMVGVGTLYFEWFIRSDATRDGSNAPSSASSMEKEHSPADDTAADNGQPRPERPRGGPKH
jgi:hypothetical protein